MGYKVLYTREAVSVIRKLPPKKQRQIKEAVERIAEDPARGKRLTHELKGLFSYRSGDYRIIYRVNFSEVCILVLTVGHRKDVYRRSKKYREDDQPD